MHDAPSVSYPVGRSLVAGALIAAVWSLGVLAVLGWSLQSPAGGWRGALGAVALLSGGVAAAWYWWRMPRGMLAWEGQGWTWTTAQGASAGDLEIGLDLQRWLLLRLRGPSRSPWLWLERSRCEERWDDLRRAVYSRARSQSVPDSPGAAEP